MTKRKLHETILADFYLYMINCCRLDIEPVDPVIIEKQFQFMQDVFKNGVKN